MFDPSLLAAATADPDTMSGFREIIDASVDETNNFDAPVYLINGDSHVFAENQPLAEGSPWLRRLRPAPPPMTCSASPSTDPPTPPTT